MTLQEALESINYDASWGIWAELTDDGILTQDSEARYGQRCFQNGGLLDAKVYVCDGMTAGDLISEWLDEDGALVDGWLFEIIDPLNEAKPWEKN